MKEKGREESKFNRERKRKVEGQRSWCYEWALRTKKRECEMGDPGRDEERRSESRPCILHILPYLTPSRLFLFLVAL